MALGSLLTGLGFAALKGEVSAVAERAGKRAGLYVLLGILWLAALGFLFAALTIWLTQMFGGIAACAIIAAAFAVLGLIVQVVLMVGARRKRPARPEVNLNIPGLNATASGAPTDIGALAVVAFVGWLLGRQMNRK